MKTISLELKHFFSTTTTSETFLSRLFKKQVENFEQYAYGMMSLYIIAPSCLASVACMMLLQINAGMLLLLPGAMLTMLTNGQLIAQSKAKVSLIFANLSILVSLITIIALAI